MEIEQKKDVKFCITAFTDLLGFASHLEIGSDLRTNIGKQAVDRLNNLEDAISFLENEKKDCPDYYPKQLAYSRINDAIVLTMDLPDIFIPQIGEARSHSIPRDFFDKVYDEAKTVFGEDSDYDEFRKLLGDRLTPELSDLELFIGLVSRLHCFLQARENRMHFPGPKTVVSTGYRKVFFKRDNTEDFLSANFAFSNAYLAESKLKGSSIYFDNHILHLASINQFGRNLVRYGLFIDKTNIFDPREDYEDVLEIKKSTEVPNPISVELFRKPYLFQEINPTAFCLFQILPSLEPYFNHTKEIAPEAGIYKSYFDEIAAGFKSFEELKKKTSRFNFLSTDISLDIRLVRDRLVDKDSDFLKGIKEEEDKRRMSSFYTIVSPKS